MGPIALIILAVSVFSALQASNFIDFIDDRIVYAIYILIVPLAFFQEIKNFKGRRIQKQIPDFLKKLASTNKTGMSLMDPLPYGTVQDRAFEQGCKDYLEGY